MLAWSTAGLLTAAAVLAGSPQAGSAQEVLYGKQAPPGSSHVRVVNATSHAVALRTNFQPDGRLGTSPTDRVGAYFVVERAAHRQLAIDMGAADAGRLTFEAAPDSYLTVVIQPGASGKPALGSVVDQTSFNQARVRVSFYNLSPSCPSASLILEQGGGVVFQAVAAGASGSRTVNPVEASVRAMCGAQPGPSLALRGLEVGVSYSIWLMHADGGERLFIGPDVLAPYKPSDGQGSSNSRSGPP